MPISVVRHPQNGIAAPNYTQIPNSLLDAMASFTEPELRIMLAICRNTFGWHTEKCSLSLASFVQLTGLSRTAIFMALKSLSDRGIIHRETDVQPHRYAINIKTDEFVTTVATDVPVHDVNQSPSEPVSRREPGVYHDVNQSVSRREPGVYHDVNHHIKERSKESTKEKGKKGTDSLFSGKAEEKSSGSKGRFVKPTVEEIADYMTEIGWRGGNAETFYDYYEANGWRVGKNPMKDWKATVRTWRRRDNDSGRPSDELAIACTPKMSRAQVDAMIKPVNLSATGI